MPDQVQLPQGLQLARLYRLIWARAIASQMSAAKLLQVPGLLEMHCELCLPEGVMLGGMATQGRASASYWCSTLTCLQWVQPDLQSGSDKSDERCHALASNCSPEQAVLNSDLCQRTIRFDPRLPCLMYTLQVKTDPAVMQESINYRFSVFRMQ